VTEKDVKLDLIMSLHLKRLRAMLRAIPNPHKNGKMTRSLLFETSPGQKFAVDAEQLHTQPKLLEGVKSNSSLIIRAFDITAYVIFGLSVIFSVLYVWWLWMPGSMICAAMLYLVQRSAGSFAKQAAQNSNDAFLYLHSIGALWVVHAAGTA